MLINETEVGPTQLPSVSSTWKSCQFWVPFLHVPTFTQWMKKSRWRFKEFVPNKAIGFGWTFLPIAERASTRFSRAIVYINNWNHLTSICQHQFDRPLSCNPTKDNQSLAMRLQDNPIGQLLVLLGASDESHVWGRGLEQTLKGRNEDCN